MKGQKRSLKNEFSHNTKKVKYNTAENDETSLHTVEQPCTNLATTASNKQKKSHTCMKHKKKDKYNCEKEGKVAKSKSIRDDGSVKRIDPNKTILPQLGGEISMNWRQMHQNLKTKKRQKTGKDHTRHKKKWKEKYSRSKSPDMANKEKESEVWFDDVDEILLEGRKEAKNSGKCKIQTENKCSSTDLTPAVGLDCEMVGVGENGQDSILARVSLVNQFGNCVYDKYVKPTEKVTDYRTCVSGIRPEDIDEDSSAEQFKIVQKEVSDILYGRLLVGHALDNDLKVLFLEHPKKQIRDTSRWKDFRDLFMGRLPSLKNLADTVLGIRIQEKEHSSVQDAQVAMRLYTLHKKKWEKDLNAKLCKPAKRHVHKASLP